MILAVPITLLFLYIGWFISSVLGVVASVATIALIYYGFTKFFQSIEVDPTESFADGVRTYIGLIFGALIFLTTPIWDSEGFCDYQTEAYEVDKAHTMEDLFKGRRSTEMRIADVSAECRDMGAWDYLGGWNSDDNWRVDFIYVILFLAGLVVIGIILFFGAIFKDIALQPNIYAKPQLNIDETISAMREHLKSLIENKDRAKTEQLNQLMPPLKTCSFKQLNEIKSLYVEVLEQLPQLYKPKEIEKGMYDRKKATIERKLASIEKQIDRSG